MKTFKIGEYNGYRHNAYDGYNCSWGVVKGLGGDQAYDAVDEKDCEHINQRDTWGNHVECDCLTVFGRAWDSGDLDIELMLQNLNTELELIKEDVNENGKHVHNEYLGDNAIPITFKKSGDDIVVSLEFDGEKHEGIAEF